MLFLSADGGDQLRLPDSFQTCGAWLRGVLGSQIQGREAALVFVSEGGTFMP